MLRVFLRIAAHSSRGATTGPLFASSVSNSRLLAGYRLMNSFSKDKAPVKANEKVLKEACGDTDDDDELEELEEMFVQGPAGMEWGGPTRGGARPEPTRFNDWERKGRCSDF